MTALETILGVWFMGMIPAGIGLYLLAGTRGRTSVERDVGALRYAFLFWPVTAVRLLWSVASRR
jgi:hypothetical protein